MKTTLSRREAILGLFILLKPQAPGFDAFQQKDGVLALIFAFGLLSICKVIHLLHKTYREPQGVRKRSQLEKFANASLWVALCFMLALFVYGM